MSTDISDDLDDIGPQDEAELDAAHRAPGGVKRSRKPRLSTLIMAGTIIALGSYLVVPTVILLIMSFNTAKNIFVGPAHWGLSNWTEAWQTPGVLESLGHSLSVWFWVTIISLPIAISIAVLLARTNIPFSKGLEYLFWVAFVFPPIASTFGWIYMASPGWGFLNKAVEVLPFVDKGPFNVFSFKGIVFVRLMADGIAYYVILLTPAFRNMDGALEDASRVSGYSSLRTTMKVTLPVMVAPIVLVMSLQIIKMFQGFEVEYMLGSRFGYYVYSTLIYQKVRLDPVPNYPDAVVLASITVVVIAMIIPLQHWITHRKQYTTINSAYKPGLLDLGRWRITAFGGVCTFIAFLTIVPAFMVLLGSFMTRVGFFDIKHVWTLDHWRFVLGDPRFMDSLKTTMILALAAGIISPIIFSLLAYLIVRTQLRGRVVLDTVIWASAAMPGILLGLGLLIMFLVTPGLSWLFGSIWPLLIVVIVAGKTTGTNVIKGVLLQLGASLEEAGRVSGGSWLRTYFKVVIPVLMPTMVLIGMLSFVHAANTTASIILLASRDTTTLSMLSLELGSGNIGRVEEGGIISLIIMVISLGLALPIRSLALRMGVRNDIHA